MNKTPILPPFKRFCVTIGNLPSSYVDSMSYYECLMWLCKYFKDTVVPAVNENAESVNELINWFNNLDVQDEIDKKLDEMVESGELQKLLSEQYNALRQEVNSSIDNFENSVNSDMDNFEESVNSQLNSFSNRIGSITSGSPAGVYATYTDLVNANPDHSKIYVVTADGKWYYYDSDNSAWTIGGTYQSTGIASGEVTYDNLEKEIKDGLTFETLTTNNLPNKGIVLPNGEIISQDSNAYGYYQVNVATNDSYKLHIYLPSDYQDSAAAVQFRDSNNNVVSNILRGEVELDDNSYYTLIVNVPANATKMLINVRYGLTSPAYYRTSNYIIKVSKYVPTNIHLKQLDSKIQEVFSYNYVLDNPEQMIDNAFLVSNDIVEYNQCEIMHLDVEAGGTYKITAMQVDQQPLLIFTSNNLKYERTVNGVDYLIKSFAGEIKNSENRHQYTDYVFTIPDYCDEIYINKWKNQDIIVSKLNSYSLVNDNPKFSKWITIGDSITEKNFRALLNYVDYIKQDMNNISVSNYAVGGSGYYGYDGTNKFVSQLSNISSYNMNNTIITVMGSVNDVLQNAIPVGSLGDTTETTLYGCMYTFFNTLFTNLNGVRLGVISPINWKGSSSNAKFVQYKQALEDTCKLFHIPYLDISDITNLRPDNSTFLNTYYEADGTGNNGEIDNNGIHPNSLGHKLFYLRIEEFIKTL